MIGEAKRAKQVGRRENQRRPMQLGGQRIGGNGVGILKLVVNMVLCLQGQREERAPPAARRLATAG
jgi:hypothetical protein